MQKSFLFILILFACRLFAQDTFSIVALDTITGEIGGAGASCIDEIGFPGSGGVAIINDIIPGRGAINTQAYWVLQNRQNAHDKMVEGLNSVELIDWLIANDHQNNPSIRQYGIVDFDSEGNHYVAAFTGDNCFNYKKQIIGPNYSIQGNTLLGESIIDSMEARFLREDGDLAHKLMAALQGANVVGADSRCAPEGVSSLSSFVRVAKPTDEVDNFYLNLTVPSTPYGVEPIDSLQILFDEWSNWVSADFTTKEFKLIVHPNPSNGQFTFSCYQIINANAQLKILDINGRILDSKNFTGKVIVDLSGYPEGIYFYQMVHKNKYTYSGKINLIK